jgi:NAD(P)H-flavin reductase
MKFFIVLVILLSGNQHADIFVFKFEQFNEIETCDNYIKDNEKYLTRQIENQFPVETIEESVVMCMTPKEINKVIEYTEDKKWQEQKPI